MPLYTLTRDKLGLGFNTFTEELTGDSLIRNRSEAAGADPKGERKISCMIFKQSIKEVEQIRATKVVAGLEYLTLEFQRSIAQKTTLNDYSFYCFSYHYAPIETIELKAPIQLDLTKIHDYSVSNSQDFIDTMNDYGDSFINRLVLGGEASTSAYIQCNSIEERREAIASLEAGLKGNIYSISAELSTQYKRENRNTNIERNIICFTDSSSKGGLTIEHAAANDLEGVINSFANLKWGTPDRSRLDVIDAAITPYDYVLPRLRPMSTTASGKQTPAEKARAAMLKKDQDACNFIKIFCNKTLHARFFLFKMEQCIKALETCISFYRFGLNAAINNDPQHKFNDAAVRDLQEKIDKIDEAIDSALLESYSVAAPNAQQQTPIMAFWSNTLHQYISDTNRLLNELIALGRVLCPLNIENQHLHSDNSSNTVFKSNNFPITNNLFPEKATFLFFRHDTNNANVTKLEFKNATKKWYQSRKYVAAKISTKNEPEHSITLVQLNNLSAADATYYLKCFGNLINANPGVIITLYAGFQANDIPKAISEKDIKEEMKSFTKDLIDRGLYLKRITNM